MDITSILTSLFTSTFVVWLTKSWISERLKGAIQNEYDQKLEAYKATLKAQSETALERLRAELQISAAKRNIEYSRIHEKRLEFISELTSKMDAFHQSVAAYVSLFEWHDGPTKEERRKISAQKFQEFNNYYSSRRLFLTPDIVKKIEAFKKGLYEISVEFMIYVEQGKEYGVNTDKHIDTWTKASAYTNTETPKIIEELESEFRKLLGMEAA